MHWRTPLIAIFAFIALDTYVFGQVQDVAEIGDAESFQIHSFPGGPAPQTVLKRCLGLRNQLCRFWQPEGRITRWTPPCEIVLHASRTAYLRAVGGFGGQTKGSSFVQFDRQRVIRRRIDLLVDGDGETPALLHEIAHIFLADFFRGQRPPRWIDEGIATMVDTTEKQILHNRDCRSALENGTALQVRRLFTLEEFQSAEQVAPFYGQSLSLVRFLTQRDAPHKLIAFSKAASKQGYDRALKQFYGFENVAALEAEWRDFATASRRVTIQPVSLSSTVAPSDMAID